MSGGNVLDPMTTMARLRKQMIRATSYLRAPPYNVARNSPANPGLSANTFKTK